MTLLIALVALLTLAGLAMAFVLRENSRAAKLPATADWIGELSVDRYRPMLRLLASEDVEFLASHGCGPRAIAEFRRQRTAIMRTYLRDLRHDFSSLCAAVKLVMATASVDRPELASRLLRTQAAFTWGLALVNIQMALYSAGLGAPPVTGLLRAFEGMCAELQSLVPAARPAGA